MPNLKPLVNNVDLYNNFIDYIESQIKITQRSLEQAHTLVDVHRLQGTIYAYRRLLKMREDVNGPEPIKTSR
tara:strand:- start:1186 stop:1401 length:216 start_codon:yes stop_codon:yes gene_type:complete